MRKFAYVYNSIVNHIVETITLPDIDGLLIELSLDNNELQEGDTYNISKLPKVPKDKYKDYTPTTYYSEIENKWILDYRPKMEARIAELYQLIASSDYKASKAVKLNQPFDELYPGEREKYTAYVEELNQIEADLEELHTNSNI